MIGRRWEHFAHGADVGVRGIGPTKESAFEEAARALTAVVVDPDRVRADTAIAVRCSAPDDGILLVDWLNAIVYEMAERGMVFATFRVRLADGALTATCAGEAVDVGRHAPAIEVKGATLTELRVERRDDGSWLAQCVVDV